MHRGNRINKIRRMGSLGWPARSHGNSSRSRYPISVPRFFMILPFMILLVRTRPAGEWGDPVAYNSGLIATTRVLQRVINSDFGKIMKEQNHEDVRFVLGRSRCGLTQCKDAAERISQLRIRRDGVRNKQFRSGHPWDP